MLTNLLAVGFLLAIPAAFLVLFTLSGRRRRELVGSMRSGPAQRTPVRERNRIGPYTIFSETIRQNGVDRFQVTISGKRLLPDAIVIVKPGTAPAERAKRPILHLDPRQFGSLNRLAGRTVIGRETEELLNRLSVLSREFIIAGDSIKVIIAADFVAVQHMPEINDLLPKLAARMAASFRGFDIRINEACLTLRESEIPEDRRIALSILLEFYPKHRWTKELLPALVQESDFDLACLAARGLGMDTERFAFSRIETGDPENQARAIEFIRASRRLTGLEFLLQFYPRAKALEVRKHIVLAFKAFADPRAETELLHTVMIDEPDVVSAAVEALAECGGRNALEPLYALSRDRSRPRSLRLAARETMRAIRERLGLGPSEAGRLSLPGTAEDAGELSLTEGTGNGRVKPSQNRTPTAGESDE